MQYLLHLNIGNITKFMHITRGMLYLCSIPNVCFMFYGHYYHVLQIMMMDDDVLDFNFCF